MAKSKKGTNMDNQDNDNAAAQIDPAKGVQAAENEFAPTLINDGGEDGARLVEPAKLVDAREEAEAVAAADIEAPDEDAEAEAAAREESQRKRELGYDLKITKRGAQPQGPVMLYDPATREGRVFGSRAEAPAHFLTGDQLNEIRAEEAAASE